MFSFLFHLILSVMNWTAVCLCNRKLYFIFLLNRPAVYFLPTAMSFSTANHKMDLFYLLKENFKNLLLDLLITGRSFENWSDLSSCFLSQRWRFWRIRSMHYETLNHSLLAKKYQRSPSDKFYSLEAFDTL